MLIEDTVRAIREADAKRQRRQREEVRLRLPVARVDEVLRELEEIHLRGGIKVPAVMIARIEALMATLPVECRAEFPLRTTITRVMDNLYAVQDCLLSRKNLARVHLQEEDHELERDDYPAA